MEVPSKHRADLDTIIRTKKPIYVVNTSTGDGASAVTAVSFTDDSGGVTVELVPYQPVPWRLDARFSRKTIARSRDLRTSLANGLLTLLTPEYAEKLLAKPETQEMLAELTKMRSSRAKTAEAQATDERKPKSDVRVSGKVMSILSQLIDKTIGETTAIRRLTLESGSMTPTDYTYVMNNSAGVYPKLNKWASDRVREKADVEIDTEVEGDEQPATQRMPKNPAEALNALIERERATGAKIVPRQKR